MGIKAFDGFIGRLGALDGGDIVLVRRTSSWQALASRERPICMMAARRPTDRSTARFRVKPPEAATLYTALVYTLRRS